MCPCRLPSARSSRPPDSPGHCGLPALPAIIALLVLAGCGRGAGSRPDQLVHLGDLLRGGGGGGAAAAAGWLPALPAGEATPEAPYEVAAELSASRIGRLRMTAAGTARLATLSWRLPQDHGFSRFRALSFPVAGDGLPHVYEVDLEREAHWHGEVKGLRLAVDVGRLRLASVTAEAPAEPYRSMSRGGETVPSLAGRRIELPLPADLPAGTRFEARVGLLPEYDRPGVTAVFSAWLVDGEQRRPWLRKTVAGGSAGGPAWCLVRRELR